MTKDLELTGFIADWYGRVCIAPTIEPPKDLQDFDDIDNCNASWAYEWFDFLLDDSKKYRFKIHIEAEEVKEE